MANIFFISLFFHVLVIKDQCIDSISLLKYLCSFSEPYATSFLVFERSKLRKIRDVPCSSPRRGRQGTLLISQGSLGCLCTVAEGLEAAWWIGYARTLRGKPSWEDGLITYPQLIENESTGPILTALGCQDQFPWSWWENPGQVSKFSGHQLRKAPRSKPDMFLLYYWVLW